MQCLTKKWNDDIRVFFVNASDQCEEVPEEVCSSVMEQICEGQERDERNNQQQRREKRSPFFGQLLKAKENFLAFLVQTLTGWNNGGQSRRSPRKPRHRAGRQRPVARPARPPQAISTETQRSRQTQRQISRPALQCRSVPKQNCSTEMRKECRTEQVSRPERSCRLVPRKQCEVVEKDHCEPVSERKCENIPRDESRKSCRFNFFKIKKLKFF